MLEKNEICLFFASDYHFEMISLPFINENLKKNKEIIVLTENNLTETANKLISNISLNEEDKKKLREVNWNNNSIEDIKGNRDKEKVIFVKGNLEYNKKINKEIHKLINKELQGNENSEENKNLDESKDLTENMELNKNRDFEKEKNFEGSVNIGKNIQIINCFDISELGTDITDITQNYDKILSTSGIKKLMK